MGSRLKHRGSEMQGRLAALRAEYVPAARHLYGDIKRAVQSCAAATSRAMRKGAVAVLAPVESALLSASGRERIHATATFALIFLFAVTSVDFLINGGPEFGAPARAAPSTPAIQAASSSSPSVDRAVTEEAAPSRPAVLSPRLASTAEASVVPVSQSFDPLSSEAMRLEESSAPSGGLDATLVDASYAEELIAPAADTASQPPAPPAAPAEARKRTAEASLEKNPGG